MADERTLDATPETASTPESEARDRGDREPITETFPTAAPESSAGASTSETVAETPATTEDTTPAPTESSETSETGSTAGSESTPDTTSTPSSDDETVDEPVAAAPRVFEPEQEQPNETGSQKQGRLERDSARMRELGLSGPETDKPFDADEIPF